MPEVSVVHVALEHRQVRRGVAGARVRDEAAGFVAGMGTSCGGFMDMVGEGVTANVVGPFSYMKTQARGWGVLVS